MTALQDAARRHLWRHFAPIGGDGELPIFVRGDGCYLWDEHGRRHLDALSSLFCVNAGHGREELGQAFFTSGGSEAVESALKLARSYHRARGEPTRVKVVARELAYHGTTYGALSVTGLPSVRTPFEPLMPGGCVAEPFLAAGSVFEHGLTFGGHPVSAAVALANLDLLEREDLLGHVREHEAGLRSALEALYELPIVGDVRGAGYFWGIELVADQDTKRPFSAAQAHELTVGLLSPELRRRGLVCRVADRGYPVIQLAPPLIAGPEQFAEIGGVLRAVLAGACTHAWA